MIDTVSILSTFNIVGSAIGISIGMASNEVVKSVVEGVILPILSLFVKRGDLENKILKIGGVNLKIGNLISNLIYFFLIIGIVLFILKYPMGSLVKEVMKSKSELSKKTAEYNKATAEHLKAMRQWNIPL